MSENIRDRKQAIALREAISGELQSAESGMRATCNFRSGSLKCDKCGGSTMATYETGILGEPATGAKSYFPSRITFCAGCYPALANQVAELHTRHKRYAPRVQLARAVREYRCAVREAVQDIPARFRHSRFRTYQPQNESQVVAVDQLRKWAGSAEARIKYPFCLIHGPCGTGKTHLEFAAFKAIAIRKCIPTYTNESKIAERWLAANRPGEREQPDDVLLPLREAGVLILDDVGKVKATDGWSNALYSIINHRYESNLPTLISTNFDLADLKSRLHPWTADRMASGIVAEIQGHSMRVAI